MERVAATISFGSLFSGIGGIDLGLERAGMECRWQVENDPYATKVLEKHWPEVTRYGDITAINWTEVETPDLICGGFPCQPVSLAGKGLAQDDPRWLWPEFERCLRVLRPRYALVENVPGLLGRGMGRVLGDLATLGYDAEWESLPAAAFGAPHLRYRVFIVAYRDGQRLAQRGESNSDSIESQQQSSRRDHVGRCSGNVADAKVCTERPGLCEGKPGRIGRGRLSNTGCTGNPWTVEPDVGRVAHGIPNRVDRLRCLGNAVVPQVAEFVGRRIVEVALEGLIDDE